MTLYHGTNCEIRVPEIRHSQYSKDFGAGFYCTEILQQAERWAMRFPTSFVNVFEYTPNPALDILEFREMTDQWLDFIADCRNGTSHSHDIVAGSMANDQVWNYVADFISGILTREQFWVLAKFKHPTNQLAFCSQNALNCLIFKESRRVKR
ncbi:MAG: DUF3990 domain-containing protein [Termitinemataceae bacterium]|nr:MAG: DUF3990 domain-containing protein [Termitinemataceae bacterium]